MEGVDEDVLLLLLVTVVGSLGVIAFFLMSHRPRNNNNNNNNNNNAINNEAHNNPRPNNSNNSSANNSDSDSNSNSEQLAANAGNSLEHEHIEANNNQPQTNANANDTNTSTSTNTNNTNPNPNPADSIHIRFKVGENERSYYLDKRSLENNPTQSDNNSNTFPITIQELKNAVFSDLISNGKTIRLIFMGLMMEDHHRIKWYNISSGMVVHVMVTETNNQNRAEQLQPQADPFDWLSSVWTLYVLMCVILTPLWFLYFMDSNQYFTPVSSVLLVLSTCVFFGSVANSLKGLFSPNR